MSVQHFRGNKEISFFPLLLAKETNQSADVSPPSVFGASLLVENHFKSYEVLFLNVYARNLWRRTPAREVTELEGEKSAALPLSLWRSRWTSTSLFQDNRIKCNDLQKSCLAFLTPWWEIKPKQNKSVFLLLISQMKLRPTIFPASRVYYLQ